jgi:hypothetical protein
LKLYDEGIMKLGFRGPAICILAMVGTGVAQSPKKLWTIGVYTGSSPLALRPVTDAANPVLKGSDVTDMNCDTLAHPFLFVKDQHYYVFFTAKDLKSDKGGIGLAESTDGVKWKFRRTIIREPFVLSHPYVFEWQHEYYLMPECHTEKMIRLYKATAFPDEWKYVGKLLEGDDYINPTLAHYKGLWWLFASPSGNETLRLFSASDVMGPWKEHPQSPIVKKDLSSGRSAGRPFVLDGTLYRYGQDCRVSYGRAVHAFRITDISPTSYAEEVVEKPVVEASGKGWNSDGMHHVDAQRLSDGKWIAVVDAVGIP